MSEQLRSMPGLKRDLTDAERQFVIDETKRLASDLAWRARRPVRVHFTGFPTAFTVDTGGDANFIDVYINPSPLFLIKSRERARKVWRGIGFHELAHHLWPADEQYKIAASEGCKDLMNALDDEQIERRLRSEDKEVGECVQTMVAWIFRGARKPDKDKQPDYVSRFNEFIYHLRRHLPGATDPVVIEALAMVPARLMDLSKDELLELVRKIHACLCRGVEAPPPVQIAEPEKEEPGKKKKKPSSKQQEEDDGHPGGVFHWRKLLKSKWSWLLLAGFVTVWIALFTRKGLEGWDTGFWALLVGAIAAIVISAAAMWLDRKLAKKRKGAPPPAKPPTKWKSMAEWFKSSWSKTKERVGKASDFFSRVTPKPVKTVLSWLAIAGGFLVSLPVLCAKFVWWLLKVLWRGLTALWKGVVWLWHNKLFRIFLLSIPFAVFLTMAAAVAVKTDWKSLLILLALLLLLALLAWLFREKLKRFVMNMPSPEPDDDAPELDFDQQAEFKILTTIVPIEPDNEYLEKVLPEVLPAAQEMRNHLEQCGLVTVDIEDQDTGDELTEDIEKAALGETALCVDETKKQQASVHIELTIDCSGSMLGAKHDLAKRFGLLTEEACVGSRGITCHFWGFSGTEIYDCGVPGERRISGLKANMGNGGNNDSAGLYQMAESAKNSGKDLKILIMVSDGAPSDCTWGSLFHLVNQLEAAGYICVQVAVDKIHTPAFKRFFVDLTGQPMPAAVIEFGRMVLSLIDEGK